jgi:hypothetical protein
MEENKESPEPERASNEWVIVKPDHLVYQKLQLADILHTCPSLEQAIPAKNSLHSFMPQRYSISLAT